MKPGKSDEWYTPKYFFDAFGVKFDLDPCHPNKETFVPARKIYIKSDDGLTAPWNGFVWMNPPFGGRNGQFPWIDKFVEHGNGIGLFSALTSSQGFQKYVPQMDAVVFPRRKTRFIDEYGNLGGCPFNGIVLVALGRRGIKVLEKCNLGIFMKVRRTKLSARVDEGK